MSNVMYISPFSNGFLYTGIPSPFTTLTDPEISNKQCYSYMYIKSGKIENQIHWNLPNLTHKETREMCQIVQDIRIF